MLLVVAHSEVNAQVKSGNQRDQQHSQTHSVVNRPKDVSGQDAFPRSGSANVVGRVDYRI
jgi:hypothetical protein